MDLQVVELQAELSHVKQVKRYEEIEAVQAAAKADVEAAQKAAQAEVDAMRAQIRYVVFLLHSGVDSLNRQLLCHCRIYMQNQQFPAL